MKVKRCAKSVQVWSKLHVLHVLDGLIQRIV